jgi:hypothetical protein
MTKTVVSTAVQTKLMTDFKTMTDVETKLQTMTDKITVRSARPALSFAC